MQVAKGLTVAILFSVPILLSAGEPGKLREIDIKGGKVITPAKGPLKTLIITSTDELAKALSETEPIKKQVDFREGQTPAVHVERVRRR